MLGKILCCMEFYDPCPYRTAIKWPTTKETKEKACRCYNSGVHGLRLQFFVAPLKNIYQNENPNDKENLEWGEEKATFNDTSVFWHPPSNLPTPEDF